MARPVTASQHGPRSYLFVVPWPVIDVGGVNQVVLNLCRQFEAEGTYVPKILVASWDHVRPVTSDENGRSVSYMRLRPPVISGAPLTSIAKWALFLLPDLTRLARYLRDNGVLHVNAHYPSLAALQFVLVAALLRRRLIITLSFHGLELTQAIRTVGLERWMWKVLIRSADAVVTCSEAQRELLLSFEPAVRPRATAIHNGIDIEHLMSSRNLVARIDPRLQGRPFILSVASYELKKGLDTLLRAVKTLRDVHGIDVELAMVGSDLGMGNELSRMAHRMDLSDHVVFCGEVPHADLHAYYEAARVFCLPSRVEPFGIVLLEAGAFRCPVVATSVGGIPEILENDVNARLVPPDDPSALAAQLQRLLSDSKECERLASALFDHVKAHFPWRRAHNSYMRLYGDGETLSGAAVNSKCLRT